MCIPRVEHCRFFNIYKMHTDIVPPQNSPCGESKISSLFSTLKPIFHCDAKKVALGPGIGLAPQRHYFVLGIPTCYYLKKRKKDKFVFLPTQKN